MCGILYHSDMSVDLRLDFADRLKKRGPDFQCLKSNEFGHWYHTRLSLIDLSSSSNQPRISPDISFVYNGEIFNYASLGSSKSDTLYLEDVLPKVIKNGNLKKFLNSLNGFFSIIAAIDNEKTYLIRDRYGEKPLYFSFGDNNLIASSSLAIVAQNSDSDLCEEELFKQAKDPFARRKTRFGLKTIYSDIYEVPPGTFMEWTRDDGIIKNCEWYDLEADISKYGNCSFYETILDAVKIRGLSKAKGAITLSGGVDSSAVAALLVNCGISLPAYTFKSSQPDYREDIFAIDNSSHLNILCNVVDEKSNLQEIGIEDIFSSIYSLERPFFDPNLAQSSIYKQLNCDGVKFSVEGHGADELFSGYQWHMPDLVIQSLLEKRFSLALKIIKEYFLKFPDNYNLFSKLKWALSGTIYSFASRFSKKKYFGYKPEGFSSFRCKEVFSRVMRGLLHNYDCVSMQHSIEVRSPFLDHRVVAIILSTRDLEFFFKSDTKQSLREILFEHDLTPIKKKIGFRSYIWNDLSSDVKQSLVSYFNAVLEYYPQAKKLTNFKNGINDADILLTSNPKEEQRFWTVISFGLFIDHKKLKKYADIS